MRYRTGTDPACTIWIILFFDYATPTSGIGMLPLLNNVNDDQLVQLQRSALPGVPVIVPVTMSLI